MNAPPISALWALSRPSLLPFVLLLVLGGYGFGHWDRALTLRGLEPLGWTLLGWTFLHAGTLWLNAAVDRDEGEVLLGRTVPVPEGIERWGYLALLGSVALAWMGGPFIGTACALAAALAVLYSHPSTLWKGHPLLGPGVNLVGYGLLTPMVGYAAVGSPPSPRAVWVWLFGSLGVLGCYFMAQAFQEKEDRARGYRTLVATHGPRTVLLTTRLCFALGLGGGMGLALAGWLPQLCLFGVLPALWVDAYLRRWSRAPGGGTAAHARTAALRLMLTGLFGLGLAFTEYVHDSLTGQPVAGLGTRAGHPPDAIIDQRTSGL